MRKLSIQPSLSVQLNWVKWRGLIRGDSFIRNFISSRFNYSFDFGTKRGDEKCVASIALKTPVIGKGAFTTVSAGDRMIQRNFLS